ncbi:MAG: ATP synthase F1 subunit delta [Oscillospiraceae bacterium]|jgi:F-type H+-transporting ATPase subunit delta|nr:ATP synthase F1 subunit delta [Oscillospiraceae bacterium]
MNDLLFGRYAEALFAIAKKQDIDEIYQQLECLLDVLQGDALRFFSSFSAAKSEKLEVLDKIGKDFEPCVFAFFKFLIEKNNICFFERIWLRFKVIYYDFKKIEEVRVFSAVPLSATQLQVLNEILQKDSKKTPEMKNVVDESLVGGIVVKCGEKVVDLSFRRRLADLRLLCGSDNLELMKDAT